MTELKPPSSHDEIRTLIDRMIDNLITIQVTDAKGLWVNPDGTVVDDKSWKEWGWPQGVGLYGIWKNYEITGNPKALKTVADWFDQALTRGTPGKNVNSVAPILTLAFLYERTGEPSYLPYLKQWGAWIYRDQTRTEGAGIQHVTVSSNNHNQLWADTLVMTVLALAKIGKVLGRPEYVEEAKYQFLIHAKFLMDPSNGLWFHGWSFDDRNNFSAAHWGRGNCWATIAIAVGWSRCCASRSRRCPRCRIPSPVCGTRWSTTRTHIWNPPPPPALPMAYSRPCTSVSSPPPTCPSRTRRSRG